MGEERGCGHEREDNHRDVCLKVPDSDEESPRVGEKGAPGRVVVRAEMRVRGAPREEVLVSGVGGERGEEDVVVGEEGE